MLVDQYGADLPNSGNNGRRMPQPEELLQDSPTAGYEPAAYYSGFQFTSGRPPFTATTVQQMLMDPRVLYGLRLLKGPLIANAHVVVQCQDENIRQYVIRQINRFWMNSAIRVLKAIEWGFCGAEVLYREVNGQVEFDTVKDFLPPDVRLQIYKGVPCGIIVRNVKGSQTQPARSPIFLGFPKAIYHIHERDRNPWYGLSRLYGAHVPWWETWSDGGFRDIRRLWFYKNSYEGGVIRHPPGNTKMPNGSTVENKELARQLVDKKRTGGTLTLPNTISGDKGEYSWSYEPPVANPAPEGLLEYGDILRDEILEALGIPPEVIQSSGDQGFGSSTGRQVPQMAFYCILQELFHWLLNDMMDFMLLPLCRIVFGQDCPEVSLQPFPLSQDLNQGGAPNDSGMEEGKPFSSDQANDFHGNQFENENQRAVFMSRMPMIRTGRSKQLHFRHNRRWWTYENGLIIPMSTAV